ncbi:MAG: glycoside hydrolase family 2 TIM barrel-domain containing protein [Akkermansiaceae bacterium]
MKSIFLLFLITHILNAAPLRQSIDLSSSWSFRLLEDKKEISWSTVNVPHDWAHQNGVSQNGAQGQQGGYYSGGVAIYRKTFTPPALTENEELHLHFDGVYMNSEVYLNGTSLGTFPYGYLSFSYELTPHLIDGENRIDVRIDNSLEPSARWYHPCGIYAPVTLKVVPKKRIDHVFITTPEITADSATINVATQAPAGLTLSHTIFFGKKEITSSKTNSLTVPTPRRWSPDSPALYTLVTRLHHDDEIIDELKTPFGIRSIKWDPATGFHLNGKVTKLLGVCEHWEGGPVGGAWTPDLLRWKLQLLKDMGVNAIRTSHNPFPPFFYHQCDELGILVMDEIFDGWIKKAPHDYGARFFDQHWEKDLTSWIIRDRNHPCVVIYSVGNETRGKVAPELVQAIRVLDPTRPVTSGHSGSEHMDVYGVNGTSEKQTFYTNYPRPKDKAFIATEAPHTWQVRGYYRSRTWFRDGFPNKRQAPFPLPDLTEKEIFTYDWTSPSKRKNRKQIFNSSYDNAMVRITARKNWELMRDNPWYAGHFRWTGFDYPGEAGYVHGGWPFRAFMGGPLDLAGFKKDLYYFYQSQWTTKPMVHLLPHWTHPKMEPGTKIPVWAYSNADEVELFLNGESLGIDHPQKDAYQMQCEWLVPWQPGTLTAIARTNGEEVARTSHITSSEPASFKLDLERLSTTETIVTTTLLDKKGIPTPYADNRIHFHLDRQVLAAHENGNPVDTENGTTSSTRRAFMGKTRTFLRQSYSSQYSAITAAAILGSRNGVTSVGDRPLVTIHTDSIIIDSLIQDSPTGALVENDSLKPLIKIHYTTDGSLPTKDSPVYKQPFTVKLPTTVKALVVEVKNIFHPSTDTPLFTMEETFAADQGLYWSDGTETAPEAENFLQAESAKLSQGAKVVGKHIDMPRPSSTLTFPLGNNGIPGQTNLIIYYTQKDPKGTRTLDLLINGQKLRTLTFKNTGSWDRHWKPLKTTIPLNKGANELTLIAGPRGGPSIDKILIKD